MNRFTLIAVLLTLSLAACDQNGGETAQAPVAAPAPVAEQSPAIASDASATSDAVPAKADEE